MRPREAWFAQRDSRRRLQPAGRHAVRGAAADGQTTLWQQGAPGGRVQPAARGRAAAGCSSARRPPGRGRAVGQPGALPVAHSRHRRAHGRTGAAGADAAGRQRPAGRRRPAGRALGRAPLPRTLAATAWAAHRQAGGAEAACPRPRTTTSRAWALCASRGRATRRPGATTLLAWQRACACAAPAPATERWGLVPRAIDAMSAAEQHDADLGLLARPRAARPRPSRGRRRRDRQPRRQLLRVDRRRS